MKSRRNRARARRRPLVSGLARAVVRSENVVAERKRWRTTGKTAIKKSRYSKVKEDDRKIQDGERRRGPSRKMNIYDATKKRWVRAKKSDKLLDGSKEELRRTEHFRHRIFR